MRRRSESLQNTLGAAFVVAVCLGCDCASADSPPFHSFEQATVQIANTRRALIAAGDPDSLAAAALLDSSFLVEGALAAGLTPDPERQKLVHRATNLAPGRYDLAWLELQLCKMGQSCDPEPIIARLQALDGRNAATWIGELPTKETSGDAARVDATIQRMAESDRFDIKYVPTVFRVATAIERTKILDTVSAIRASAGVRVVAEFATWAISRACNAEALKRAERLRSCKRLAAVMRNGDTYDAELVGIGIAKRVWPKASTSYNDATKAARRAHYRQIAISDAARNHVWDDAYARKYLGWLASSSTEQEVYRAELANAGLDPEPPPYYQEPEPSSG